MATWPAGLPQRFAPEGFQLTYEPNTARTQITHGPPKARRIGIAMVEVVVGKIEIVNTMYSIFANFYKVTLQSGAEPFDWVHPIDESSVVYQYRSEPVFTPSGGVNWDIAMDLEILP